MRTRAPKHPPLLVPLRYGEVYCELCKDTIRAGDRVAWWKVTDYLGLDVPRSQRIRTRKAAYCRTCHRANIRAGRALRRAA
jgi:hypothetical protein